MFWFCNGVSEGLARSIEEKGAVVEGKRIPNQDLGLPDFSMDNSDSDSEMEESSASSCSSGISEKRGMVLNNRRDDSSVDKDGTFSSPRLYSETPIVSVKSPNDTTECEISPKENNDSFSSDQSVLSFSHSSSQIHSPERRGLGCVNLDVTAMIAYVSATANGGANFIFQDKFLSEQAACERRNPVKKTLHQYFEGKKC